MQKGSSPNATTRLPLGDPLHDYAIALEIQIIDSLGAGTLEILVVYVCCECQAPNSEFRRNKHLEVLDTFRTTFTVRQTQTAKFSSDFAYFSSNP